MQNPLIKKTLVTLLAMGAIAVPMAPALAQSGGGNNNNGSSGSRLFDLYQQIQQLQQQVRNLNGEVDTLKYQLKQNEKGQRQLYQNLDQRLSKLENGAGGQSGAQSQSGGAGGGAASGSSANTAAGGGKVDQATHAAYMDGFNKLKNGQYDAAIAAFKQFVAKHPHSSLTDNAWYWLGETYYVQQKLGKSEKSFDTVVNQFSDSSKVPSALYKIGLIKAAQNHSDKAKATLQRVVDQYPNSDAAGLAKKKLQSLGSGG